jgi:hypothetical protein
MVITFVRCCRYADTSVVEESIAPVGGYSRVLRAVRMAVDDKTEGFTASKVA